MKTSVGADKLRGYAYLVAALAHRTFDSLGNDSQSFQADFAKLEEVVKLFDKVVEEYGVIDVLVNNAGIAVSSNMDAKDNDWLQGWNETIKVNLTATALLCKRAIEHFAKRKSGRIINITSRAAFQGESPEYLAYGISKAGLVNLTKSIARAYGKDGIKVFSIAPGFTRTDMAEDFVQQYGEKHVSEDIALEKLTEPKDIAPFVTFLASGMGDHATGTTIDINAGSYVH